MYLLIDLLTGMRRSEKSKDSDPLEKHFEKHLSKN